MADPPATREARRKKRLAERGLVQVNVWVHRTWADTLRKIAEGMKGEKTPDD